MPLTPEQRILRARLAGSTGWARTADRRARALPGLEGLLNRFRREIDPERKLSAEELERRVQSALKAHMARMALNSSKARAARKAKSEVCLSHNEGTSVGGRRDVERHG